jgi:hypothetical protein
VNDQPEGNRVPHLDRQVQRRYPDADEYGWSDEYAYVGIDEHIVDLIDELWRLGFETCMSCQGIEYRDGTHGPAWVTFATREEAHRFAALVTGSDRPQGWEFTQGLVDDDPNDDDTTVSFPPDVIPVAVAKLSAA